MTQGTSIGSANPLLVRETDATASAFGAAPTVRPSASKLKEHEPTKTDGGSPERGTVSASVFKSSFEEPSKEPFKGPAQASGAEPPSNDSPSNHSPSNHSPSEKSLSPQPSAVESPLERLQLAFCCLQNQRLDQARELYESLLAASPQSPTVLPGLARLAQALGEVSVAQACMERAVEIEPDSVSGWFDLGNVYFAGNHFVKAVQAYSKAVALKPDSPIVYNNLGYALYRLGQLEESVYCYTRAIKLKPDWIEAEVSLANAMQTLGRLSAEEQSHYSHLNYQLGLRQQQAGNLENAAEYFQHALAMNSGFDEARSALEEALGLSTPAFYPPSSPAPEQSDLEILQKLSGSIWKWAKTGFALVDEATLQRRTEACIRCPHLAEVPKSLWYRAITLNSPDEKICSLCGCVISKKVPIASESCPDRHPSQAGLNRWQEPFQAPTDGEQA